MMTTTNYGTCNTELGPITLTSEANHSCNPYHPNRWDASGKSANGEPVRVYWDFSDAEVKAAGEDASSLPWDDEHVAKAEIA